MRRRLLLGLVPALPCAILLAACQTRPVDVGLALSFPEGLLDQATGVTLSVFDASLAHCDAATGVVSAIPAGNATQTFQLEDTGCADGDAWCKTITLNQSSAPQMFAIVATAAGTTLAEGCTTTVVDEDTVVVEIQALRYLAPPCCNDGVLQAGEQCDTGERGSCTQGAKVAACTGIVENPVCFCDCTAKEILLSVDDPQAPFLQNAPAGSKTNLALSFGPGGVYDPVMLRAVYQSDDPNGATGVDLHASYLREDLYPVRDPLPLSLQLQFPVLCDDVEGTAGVLRDQDLPAIATAAADTVAVVYQSDEINGGGDFDVFLSPQIPDGCSDDPPCTAGSACQTSCDANTKSCAATVQINVTSGGSTQPRLAAGPEGAVLVTWTRASGVFGRIWHTDGTLVPATGEISIAQGASAARVAGGLDGFLVVYQGPGAGDQNGVFLRTVGAMGNVGNEVRVNASTASVADQPDIAMLDDGSAALVVWHSDGDVYFQHFSPSGTAVGDDQTGPLNTVGAGPATDQQHPAVAGANGFFTVAWETPDPTTGLGNVSARFVGAMTGFGYNSVSGQDDEFIATDPLTMGDRYLPAVAMGTYVAIGWEDHAAAHAGVYVRRFPPPAD